jgi:hypothetical protein
MWRDGIEDTFSFLYGIQAQPGESNEAPVVFSD